jgi:hypothetical protein
MRGLLSKRMIFDESWFGSSFTDIKLDESLVSVGITTTLDKTPFGVLDRLCFEAGCGIVYINGKFELVKTLTSYKAMFMNYIEAPYVGEGEPPYDPYLHINISPTFFKLINKADINIQPITFNYTAFKDSERMFTLYTYYTTTDDDFLIELEKKSLRFATSSIAKVFKTYDFQYIPTKEHRDYAEYNMFALGSSSGISDGTVRLNVELHPKLLYLQPYDIVLPTDISEYTKMLLPKAYPPFDSIRSSWIDPRTSTVFEWEESNFSSLKFTARKHKYSGYDDSFYKWGVYDSLGFYCIDSTNLTIADGRLSYNAQMIIQNCVAPRNPNVGKDKPPKAPPPYDPPPPGIENTNETHDKPVPGDETPNVYVQYSHDDINWFFNQPVLIPSKTVLIRLVFDSGPIIPIDLVPTEIWAKVSHLNDRFSIVFVWAGGENIGGEIKQVSKWAISANAFNAYVGGYNYYTQEKKNTPYQLDMYFENTSVETFEPVAGATVILYNLPTLIPGE